MLIYDALDGRFLTIKLRPRQSCCSVCGDNPTINKLQDYELFCGASATDKVIRRKKLIINVQPPLTSDHLSNFYIVTPCFSNNMLPFNRIAPPPHYGITPFDLMC